MQGGDELLVSQVRLVLIFILKMGRESKSADKRVSIFDTCEKGHARQGKGTS